MRGAVARFHKFVDMAIMIRSEAASTTWGGLLAHAAGFIVCLSLLTTSTVVEATSVRDTGNWKSTNFDDGTLGPFVDDYNYPQDELEENGFTFPNCSSGGKCMKITWKESEYDGTRAQRGHEIRQLVNSDYEVFSGFQFFVPDDKFPHDKNTIVWQLYNWNRAGCDNWTAHMSIEDNKLVMDYRPACVASTKVTILTDIPRDKWMRIVIRARAGRGEGKFDVYVDGTRELRLREINLGFGEFTDGVMDTSVMGVKMGMYCADVSGYSTNEVRELYWDNMASAMDMEFRDGKNAVDPNKN